MWHLRGRKQFIRIWCTLAWSCSGLMPTQIKQLASREDVYFDDDHINREHWRSRGKDTQSQAWNRRRSRLGWAASQALPTRALLVWGSSTAAKRLWSTSFSTAPPTMHSAGGSRRRAEVVAHGHSWSSCDSPCLEPGPGKAGPSAETAVSPHLCSQGWAVTVWIRSWVN